VTAVRLRQGARLGPVALDVGTGRTRIHVADRGLVLDEPTLLAYGPRGDVLAAGHRAWAAATGHGVRLVWPVRRGVVVDPVSCVHLLRLLLRQAGAAPATDLVLATAVPTAASTRDTSVLTAAVASAGGGSVLPISAELAAAVGAGVDIADTVTNLVCDLGAGVIEVAATGDGRVLASSRIGIGAREFDEAPQRVLGGMVVALREVLDALPEHTAADLAARPVVLVGGGALRPGLAAALSAAWRAPVTVAGRPRDAVILGLGTCVAQLHPPGTRYGAP
jgi:actin-like ATPase involved in cell morphogenesis